MELISIKWCLAVVQESYFLPGNFEEPELFDIEITIISYVLDNLLENPMGDNE
jgi:hypothetical protein